MQYATSSPNVLTLIAGSSSAADLVTQLVAAFVAGGWTVHASITGGSTLLGASPQGYQVYCDIAKASTSLVYVQLHSAVGSGAAGAAHLLAWSVGVFYQVIAHPCGFAICQPTLTSSIAGSTAIGGIPSVATACGVAGALGTVTEVWFSFGDANGSPFNFAANPRYNIDAGDLGGVGLGSQTGCFNGAMASVSTSDNPWTAPEIPRISSLAAESGAPASNDSHPLFYGELPMTYPAFVIWPDTVGGPMLIRGQIYNAAVRSASTAKQASTTFDGFDWVNFTDAWFWGSLWLMSGSVTPASRNLQNVQY